MPRNHGVFSVFSRIFPTNYGIILGCKTNKKRFLEHSTWHKLLKEELPDHYFSKINQFMDQGL